MFFVWSCAGSVFCVALDPVSNTLAVTGGEDDRAYVWTVCDGDVLFECTGLYLFQRTHSLHKNTQTLSWCHPPQVIKIQSRVQRSAVTPAWWRPVIWAVSLKFGEWRARERSGLLKWETWRWVWSWWRWPHTGPGEGLMGCWGFSVVGVAPVRSGSAGRHGRWEHVDVEDTKRGVQDLSRSQLPGH